MTLSESALEVLDTLQPLSAQQQRLRREFIQHIGKNHDGWSRACLPDHLTASAVVLDDTRRYALLGLHRKVGIWLQFGGHIEPTDSSLVAAAQREAVEESGIAALTFPGTGPLQLDRHAAPCGAGARHHLDVQFLALTRGCPRPVTSAESLDVRWWMLDDLPDLEPEMHELIALARERLAQSS